MEPGQEGEQWVNDIILGRTEDIKSGKFTHRVFLNGELGAFLQWLTPGKPVHMVLLPPPLRTSTYHKTRNNGL